MAIHGWEKLFNCSFPFSVQKWKKKKTSSANGQKQWNEPPKLHFLDVLNSLFSLLNAKATRLTTHQDTHIVRPPPLPLPPITSSPSAASQLKCSHSLNLIPIMKMIHVLWNGLLSSALHFLSLIPIMTMIPVKWSSSYVAFQVLSIPWSIVVMTIQYLYHVPLREVKVLSVLAKKGVCCIFAAQTLARQCRVDTPIIHPQMS